MHYEWDEEKRKANLKSHGLDFVDAPRVFAGPTFTFEDDRFAYQEQRFVSLGLLEGTPVALVHTESPVAIRLISFRRATTHETSILLEKIIDQLPTPPLDDGQGHTADRRTPGSRRKAHRSRHRAKRPKGRST
jgi:uncharacterized DUF497 family protein